MHDKEARKEIALDAEWDKKRDVKEKRIEGLGNTKKGTRWGKMDIDMKACEELH